jgi:hypothetical protein
VALPFGHFIDSHRVISIGYEDHKQLTVKLLPKKSLLERIGIGLIPEGNFRPAGVRNITANRRFMLIRTFSFSSCGWTPLDLEQAFHGRF